MVHDSTTDCNRFTVSTVEAETKKNGIHMGASIISRPLRSSTEVTDAPNGQAETWLHDAGWRRKRSLAQLTREALPRLENYRHSRRALKRPSLGELHGDHLITEVDEKELRRETKSPTPTTPTGGIKLGWIQGVLIPCLLNIWGVMLFLRISWVVAQAGIGLSLIIIAISAVVCVITTLSMSAICTNGEVKGGGIYYIISRSLGPEFGASVGIIFAFANAVAASMNTIGFCDSLTDLLKNNGLKIIDNAANDTRIIGTLALIVMCVICAVGMDWESKAQNFLIAIIVGAMVDFVVGTIMGPKSNEEIAQGFVGLSSETLSMNFYPDFRMSEGLNQDFFSVFAIFFPSVTGLQAGANISGDLKDPASAIPKGTLLALLISMVSYAFMVMFSGVGALRDASGNLTGAFDLNGTLDTAALAMCGNATHNATCVYGLHNSYSVMQLMSAWGPFIYGGCWAATLSTALTNLLSVPRLIQALGTDRIYPGLIFFSKPYGKHGEPYRGYVLTFFVSLVFLLIADLNTIAPLITNFYLASYALINFCTFHAAVVRPLGWRPTFRYYNVWVSLLGFLMCVAIMLLISWEMSLVTFAIFFTLYLIVHYRDPDVNWGSSTQAQIYKTALSSAHSLARTGEHVKNYWPQLLVLAGRPQHRPALIDLGNLITKAGSLMIVGAITQNKLVYRERSAISRMCDEWLRARKVKAFYNNVNGFGFEFGARALIQSSGVGRLAPNVLLMGYKNDWTTAPANDLVAYFNVLHTAFENRLAVAILRVQGGLDHGAVEESVGTLTATSGSSGELRVRPDNIMHADSDLDIRGSDTSSMRHNLSNLLNISSSRSFNLPEMKDNKEKKKDKKPMDIHRQIVYKSSSGAEISKDQLTQMTIFQKKQEGGTIDVWWLYDDGGLTILLPYIISQRSAWSNCKLRVFALANRTHEMELEERNMANLLSKFRIDYSSLTMVQDITEAPKPETKALFEELTKKFIDEAGPEEARICETEMLTLCEKTNRQLRLRELLLDNSRDTRLVIMSLPMPRKGSVSAPLYMAWLEMLSRDLPPVLFVRGNQLSVLTFYS